MSKRLKLQNLANASERESALIAELERAKDSPVSNVIPSDPNEFYKDFGLLVHPHSGEPVQQLTAYQRRVWLEIQDSASN